MDVNVEVDERALREIYLPGFEAAVKDAGVLTIMGAYNQFRGQHATYNNYLINTILKKEWGFTGVVISDWGATHSTMEAARGGLDLEMGTIKPTFDEYYMARPLLDSIKAGKLDETIVDDKVRRILRLMCRLNLIGTPPPDTTGMQAKLGLPQRAQVAQRIAEEGAVLLKNNNQFLPLDIHAIKSIAVIGANANLKHARGGGSTVVKARYEITPLAALKKMAGEQVQVTYAKGYQMTVANWGEYSPKKDKIDSALLKQAIKIAKQADVVIFVGGLNHDNHLDSEGSDKYSMKLPYKQDEVIADITQANPKTVVVLITGGPVELDSWVDKIPALLTTSYNGMEGGTALANILFGKVNPSGKLTDTWPYKLEDTPVAKLGEYPGTNGIVKYNEGIYVGYRYFDTKQVTPRYPFGYGLSYTRIEYSGLKVPKQISNLQRDINVSFTVKNTGSVAGKEVAQLYVSNPGCSIERPVHELKQFIKVDLQPGETKQVTLTLNKRAFQYYNVQQNDWVAEPGRFEIQVGASSRDIRLKADTELK
jgi:beta-glucosidase